MSSPSYFFGHDSQLTTTNKTWPVELPIVSKPRRGSESKTPGVEEETLRATETKSRRRVGKKYNGIKLNLSRLEKSDKWVGGAVSTVERYQSCRRKKKVKQDWQKSDELVSKK